MKQHRRILPLALALAITMCPPAHIRFGGHGGLSNAPGTFYAKVRKFKNGEQTKTSQNLYLGTFLGLIGRVIL